MEKQAIPDFAELVATRFLNSLGPDIVFKEINIICIYQYVYMKICST